MTSTAPTPPAPTPADPTSAASSAPSPGGAAPLPRAAAVVNPARLIRGAQPLAPVALSPRPRAALSRWLTGLTLLVLVSGFAIYSHRRVDAEIRAMPASERRTLFTRTLTTLSTLCARDAEAHADDLTVLATSATSALGDHCAQEATFILRFPECDRACRRLAERFLPKPVR